MGGDCDFYDFTDEMAMVPVRDIIKDKDAMSLRQSDSTVHNRFKVVQVSDKMDVDIHRLMLRGYGARSFQKKRARTTVIIEEWMWERQSHDVGCSTRTNPRFNVSNCRKTKAKRWGHRPKHRASCHSIEAASLLSTYMVTPF